ncbi:cocaine- and amphetamine-regulated transcript protein-like [Archocentrus centrarchus]|uniref:cocaine- and amphetamine-regulated transcript protein-like n=1 Tax=Archocentrus centrarchus TaxID=63155 RepID=UPI0011E9FB6A|nr:cocaine- and amphetamine-regulated transcript protein-like [Archocentrus centrarchus]
MRPAAVAASLSTVLLCVLLLRHAAAAESGRRRTDEVRVGGQEKDTELLMVLQNVLEKLQSRKLSTLKRRQSRLPTCEVGAWCSVKKGPHFGQLCDFSERLQVQLLLPQVFVILILLLWPEDSSLSSTASDKLHGHRKGPTANLRGQTFFLSPQPA